MPALITLRIIHKKMKPRVWFQIEVPSGITFSSLSILVDSAIGYQADPDGVSEFALFEFHQYSSSMIFREGIFEDGSKAGYYLSLREANSTFIDEYLEVGDWISYTPDEWRTDQYRIEVKCITACDLPMPRMTKASKGAYEILRENVNWYRQRSEELSRYQIEYDDHFSFLTRNELFKRNRHEGNADSSVFLLPGMKSPVSKSDNSIDSVSSNLNLIVDLFADALLLKFFITENHTSLRECLFLSYSEEDLDRMLEHFNISPDSPIPEEMLQQFDTAPVIEEFLKLEKQSAAAAQSENLSEAAEEMTENAATQPENPSEAVEEMTENAATQPENPSDAAEEMTENAATQPENPSDAVDEMTKNAASDDTRRDLFQSIFSVEKIFKARTESERTRSIRKALLAASHLLEADIMTQFFMKKNDRQMATFRKAAAECEKYGAFLPASFNESDDMAAFAENDYVFFHKEGEECDIPSDVITAFREIDTPAFNQRRQQYVWLTDCLDVVQYYYGVIPINQFYKLYSQFGNLSKNEMLKEIRGMDSFDNPNKIIGNRLVYGGWVHDDEYKNLEKIQADKPFYFPSKAEVEDLSWNGYPTQQKEVKKLFSVCKKAFGIKGIDAEDLVEEIWYRINQGEQILDIMDLINSKHLIFNNDKVIEQFIDAINDINNYSHLLYNRGQTPKSLSSSMLEHFRRGGDLRIVPGSTTAAEMLGKIAPDLQREGFHIDLDANASEIDSAIMDSSGELHTFKKKIYPNDPCPCGSGKKYKKCHGRK